MWSSITAVQGDASGGSRAFQWSKTGTRGAVSCPLERCLLPGQAVAREEGPSGWGKRWEWVGSRAVSGHGDKGS